MTDRICVLEHIITRSQFNGDKKHTVIKFYSDGRYTSSTGTLHSYWKIEDDKLLFRHTQYEGWIPWREQYSNNNPKGLAKMLSEAMDMYLLHKTFFEEQR